MKKRTGRNEDCPCGSGKKFKKCCERMMISGRYKAARIGQESASLIQKTVNMTSLFQTRLSLTPKKPIEDEGEISSFFKHFYRGCRIVAIAGDCKSPLFGVRRFESARPQLLTSRDLWNNV